MTLVAAVASAAAVWSLAALAWTAAIAAAVVAAAALAVTASTLARRCAFHSSARRAETAAIRPVLSLWMTASLCSDASSVVMARALSAGFAHTNLLGFGPVGQRMSSSAPCRSFPSISVCDRRRLAGRQLVGCTHPGPPHPSPTSKEVRLPMFFAWSHARLYVTRKVQPSLAHTMTTLPAASRASSVPWARPGLSLSSYRIEPSALRSYLRWIRSGSRLSLDAPSSSSLLSCRLLDRLHASASGVASTSAAPGCISQPSTIRPPAAARAAPRLTGPGGTSAAWPARRGSVDVAPVLTASCCGCAWAELVMAVSGLTQPRRVLSLA